MYQNPLDQLLVMRAIISKGCFSAAAQSLTMTPSTIGHTEAAFA